MSMDNLITLVNQYAEARELMQIAEAEMDALKAQITAEMQQRGESAMLVGTHKIALAPFTSNRLDSKAIKIVAPELYAEHCKAVSGVRFTCT